MIHIDCPDRELEIDGLVQADAGTRNDQVLLKLKTVTVINDTVNIHFTRATFETHAIDARLQF